jgi:D-glycero-D-manno-heptose 1,7-bisphosphate phosphatase
MSVTGACEVGASSPRRRAVFLDRDGVLNRPLVIDGRPYPPRCPEETELLPGVEDACRMLLEAGALLICVTNQPELARGTQKPDAVAAINDRLRAALGLHDVRVCPHDDSDGCSCRKPRPGLLTAAAADYGIDLAGSVMVGDRWRDIEAGRMAGCTTIFIDHGYSERQPEQPDFTFASLPAAVSTILAVLRQ